MKKTVSYFLMACTIMILAAGCKGKDAVANDPRAVVIAFFERMSKKDLEGAAKLATKDSKGTLDMMKKAMDAGEKMGIKDTSSSDDPSKDFKNMVIGEAKINGDNATVSVSNPSKDDKIKDFPLKKEDGQWKVDFSMATLMKMGMDKASESSSGDNTTTTQDTTGVTDKMNEYLNGDSLAKGLKDMDSLLKSIDPEKLKQMKEALKNLEKTKE